MNTMEILKYLGRRVNSPDPFVCTYIDEKGRFQNLSLVAVLLWYGKTDQFPRDEWLLQAEIVLGDGSHNEAEMFSVDNLGIKEEVLRL